MSDGTEKASRSSSDTAATCDSEDLDRCAGSKQNRRAFRFWENRFEPKRFANWFQVIANIAAALTLLMAAIQYQETSRQERVRDSISILERARSVEQDWENGDVRARDVVNFYYEVWLYSDRKLLDVEVLSGTKLSLESLIGSNLLFKQYWNSLGDGLYAKEFSDTMNRLVN